MPDGYSALVTLCALLGILVLFLFKVKKSMPTIDEDSLNRLGDFFRVLRRKNDLLEADESGRTLLMQAAAQGFEDGVEYILVMGGEATINQATEDGTTALHCAVISGNPAVIARLLSFGADPNQADRQGRTPLWFAVQQEDGKATALLLDYQADPNCRVGENGMTPLMAAVKNGRIKVVATLIKGGADPSLLSLDGRTAAHFAREHLDANTGNNVQQNQRLLRMVLYLESLSEEKQVDAP